MSPRDLKYAHFTLLVFHGCKCIYWECHAFLHQWLTNLWHAAKVQLVSCRHWMDKAVLGGDWMETILTTRQEYVTRIKKESPCCAARPKNYDICLECLSSPIGQRRSMAVPKADASPTTPSPNLLQLPFPNLYFSAQRLQLLFSIHLSLLLRPEF